MELTPQLLTDEIDFRIAVRGYDRNEVDDFLERVAVAVGQLQSQLTKAVARAKAAERRLAEYESGSRDAGPVADAVVEPEDKPVPAAPAAEVRPEVPPAAPRPAEKPEPSTTSTDDDLNEELRRTLVLAQRTADTAIREAHEQAKSIVSEANDDARRARDEARGRLVAEIAELEAVRESMRDDTIVLERYLGTERARVRETIQVLRRLVDDPRSFQIGVLPELSAATIPDDDEVDPTAASGEIVDLDDAVPAVAELPAASAEAPVDEVAHAERTSLPAPNDEPAYDDLPVPTEDAGGVEAEPLTAQARDADGAETVDDATAVLPRRTASDSESLGQLFDAADANRDWRSARTDRGDQGPHTQPVAAARFEEESDEAFLAELRRAMDDDQPLGPEA